MDVLQNNMCIKHNDYYVRDFINMVDDVLRLIYIQVRQLSHDILGVKSVSAKTYINGKIYLMWIFWILVSMSLDLKNDTPLLKIILTK